MKPYSVSLEFRTLRTLAQSSNTKTTSYIFSALDESCFHSTVCKSIYKRVKYLAQKRAVVLDWSELATDPAIDEKIRERIKLYKKKPLKNKSSIKRALERIHEYRKIRMMYYAASGVFEAVKQPTVNAEELLNKTTEYITAARSSTDSRAWFSNFGIKGDSTGQKLVKKALSVTKDRYIQTGFSTFDVHNIGIPLGSFMMVGATTGSGKCLVGDSLVATNRGIFSLKEIWNSSNLPIKNGFKKINYGIFSHKGKEAQASHAYRTKGKTIKITFSDGSTMEGLSRHKLWATTAHSEQFIRLDKINKNMLFKKYLGLNSYGKETDLSYYVASSNIYLPKNMTNELATFLGLLISDGACCRNHIIFTSCNERVRNWFYDAYTHLFNKEPRKEGQNQIILNCNYVCKFIHKLLGGKFYLDQHMVPLCIRKANKSYQQAFLRGLFEGDGSVYIKDANNKRRTWCFEYSTVSRYLIEHIKAMLENMGISCYLRKKGHYYKSKPATGRILDKKHKMYSIIIDYKEIDKIKNIGFISEEKTNKLNMAVEKLYNIKNKGLQKTNLTACGWNNTFPAYTLKICKSVISSLEDIANKYTHDASSNAVGGGKFRKPYIVRKSAYEQDIRPLIHSKREVISRYSLIKLIKFLNKLPKNIRLELYLKEHDNIQYLKSVAYNNWIYPVKIEHKNKTKRVYDLSVPGPHSYITNSIVSHNSIMMAQLCENMALNGARVCFIPLEMDGVELTQRHLSRVSNTPINEILRPFMLSKAKKRDIREKAKEFENKLIKSGGTLTLYVPEEDMTMEDLLFILKPYGYSVIAIDYIGLTKGHDGKEQWKSLGSATRYCKRYATATNSVVIGAAQLDAENRLKYSKTMEEHANLAWYWDYDDKAKDAKVIEIRQKKSRTQNGFTFYLGTNFNYMKFENLTREKERDIENAKKQGRSREEKEKEEKETSNRRKEHKKNPYFSN